MKTYFEVSKKVAPKKAMVKELEEKLSVAKEKLDTKLSALNQGTALISSQGQRGQVEEGLGRDREEETGLGDPGRADQGSSGTGREAHQSSGGGGQTLGGDRGSAEGADHQFHWRRLHLVRLHLLLRPFHGSLPTRHDPQLGRVDQRTRDPHVRGLLGQQVRF